MCNVKVLVVNYPVEAMPEVRDCSQSIQVTRTSSDAVSVIEVCGVSESDNLARQGCHCQPHPHVHKLPE
eukprot:6480662-Amphidinium_carterae.1